MASWAVAAEHDNLEARVAAVAAEISRREIAVQRAVRLPTVDLIGVHGRFSQGGGVIFGLTIPSNTVTQTTIGVQLTVPLFTSGAIDSRVRQAAAAHEVADDQAEEARREASLGARQAYVAIVTGLDRIRADQQALASSRTTLVSTQLAFEVGKRLNSDVLNAQQQLASADEQLQQARYETLLAQLQLKAAAGALDDAELERVNALLKLP
jgi:outer membrane protein